MTSGRARRPHAHVHPRPGSARFLALSRASRTRCADLELHPPRALGPPPTPPASRDPSSNRLRSALEKVKSSAHSFDMVLTDLAMPKLDGIAFAQELTRLGCVAPIVLVSGRDVDIAPEALTNANIAAILPKPFTLNELEGTVARLLSPADGAAAP
ncbi:MAG TPA: response regulator [Labilithrix sp.]|nr:response regulator [Labilithrix sp.]